MTAAGGRPDRLDEAHLRFVDVGGVRTRVYDAGTGEPFVLLHGGGYGSLYSLDSWSTILEELTRSHRVVAFDKLGQGYTDNPASESEYTYDAHHDHAIAVLDELGVANAHLVGHSMGAHLAARIALDRPDLARTVVAIDTNTLAPDDDRFPRSKFYLDLAKRVPPGPPTRETVRMEPDEQSFSRDHVSDDFVDRLLAIAQRPENAEAKAISERLRDSQWLPSLNAARARTLAQIDEGLLTVPTLVVWAENDVSAPLPLALTLYARITPRTPEAELHVFSRAGHYVYREHPDAFLRVLLGFCAGRGSP